MADTSSLMYWRGRLEKALASNGATAFGYSWSGLKARFFFIINDHQCAIDVGLPDRNAKEFTYSPTRHTPYSDLRREQLYEAAVRERWRIVARLVESKFEAVHAGVVDAAAEFGQYVPHEPLELMPSGSADAT